MNNEGAKPTESEQEETGTDIGNDRKNENAELEEAKNR
jgi:hypothetical protein